ncbi:hypothetical protein BJ322DRAFT_395234 [Thelephora terrestris]|uniref:PARP catalytic domain-containing protein n=1 Tax=Thelephora terrestris TaxID=56493 RepID=A0A9P6HMF4_9AGAM|nr:hypothetical protein BJ322DRAFT_395234 [Thelephora terrestris]
MFVPPRLAVSPPSCPSCKNTPVLPNPATGGYFDYCSRSCATQARNITTKQWNGQLGTSCEQCKRRPKFKDGTNVYQYCGRTCARLAANASRSNQTMNSPVNPSSLAHPVPPQPASSGRTCRTPGCTRAAFVHHDGTPSDYCAMNHKKWSEHGCISCRAAPRSTASVLCQTCYDSELSKAPALVQVPEDHQNFKSVESQFQKTWKGTACPEVKAIYKIIVAEASLKQYKQYLDGVEARGNFVAMGKSRGNENRRWHGTTRSCTLGDAGNKTLCTGPGCPLCCIIRTSFNLAVASQGNFGRGIYTSATSSKSNGYSRNAGIISDCKAMLLNTVVVGYGKKVTQTDMSLTQPPAGYDSILGEVGVDELIVYNNDAVRPSYLVMYKSP